MGFDACDTGFDFCVSDRTLLTPALDVLCFGIGLLRCLDWVLMHLDRMCVVSNWMSMNLEGGEFGQALEEFGLDVCDSGLDCW